MKICFSFFSFFEIWFHFVELRLCELVEVILHFPDSENEEKMKNQTLLVKNFGCL
jgi:hypothetical protein